MKKIFIMALLLCFGFSFYAIAEWSNPTETPSGGNVPPPINTGDVSQVKNGALGINGLLRGYSDLYVDGDLGVGTTDPDTKLEVVGGPIKATGGLIIETRTDDPASPADGQIWLRTDI